MKIGFCDFWPDFNPNNNFFVHTLKTLKDNLTVTNLENADIIIYSCFGSSHRNYNCKKIFFTGENIRPNFNECNYSFTFDVDDYNGKNIRIPLWYLYIDWYNVKTYDNPNYLIPVYYIDTPNIFRSKNKLAFCSSVFSSPKKERIDIINLLRLYKPTDCYGKVHQYNLPDGELYKMEAISNYKFNICFENIAYNGYHTEKYLHAKVAGCIPIYYSANTLGLDFNVSSGINLINFSSMEEFVDHIKTIDSNDKLYKDILEQPLFNYKEGLTNIKNEIYKIL